MERLDLLKNIGSANAQISSFLENAPSLSTPDNGSRVNLAGISKEVAALMVTIQQVGQKVQASQLSGTEAGTKAEISVYLHNLDRLKEFLTTLRSYAEARRSELAAQSRKMSGVLAWCDAVKLSNLK